MFDPVTDLTPEEKKNTDSLGDGAYVTFTGGDFHVWCERDGEKHWVALDVKMIDLLHRIAGLRK